MSISEHNGTSSFHFRNDFDGVMVAVDAIWGVDSPLELSGNSNVAIDALQLVDATPDSPSKAEPDIPHHPVEEKDGSDHENPPENGKDRCI